MAIHTTVYKADPGRTPFGYGDAQFANGSAVANDPTETTAVIGEEGKNFSKLGYCWRTKSRNPLSGPIIYGQRTDGAGSEDNFDNVKAEILRSKIEFEVATTAITFNPEGEFRVAVYMGFVGSLFFLDAISFSPSIYTTRGDLPWLSTDDQAFILTERMEGDDYVSDFTSTSGIISYDSTTFTAGTTISIGDGYEGLYAEIALSDRLNEMMGQRAMRTADTNLVSQIGLAIDPWNTPNAVENFSLWSSASEPAHSGLILTIEWDDHRSINIT